MSDESCGCLTHAASTPCPYERPNPRVRWVEQPMDAEYLDRLEPLCQPTGDLASRLFRYGPDAGPELDGQVAIWQVEIRGDDALELIRLARIALDR